MVAKESTRLGPGGTDALHAARLAAYNTTWRHLRAGVYAAEPLLLMSPEEMARSLRALGEPPVTNGRAIGTLIG